MACGNFPQVPALVPSIDPVLVAASDALRRKVEGFLGGILARQRLRVDLDLGLWYDGNVNNAAEVGTVAIPAFGSLVFEVDQRPVLSTA